MAALISVSVAVPIDQRFAQLIKQFGLTKNSFAISLGKTASVVQHLIDGRNKPGFDLLCKVFEIYPNVSRDWLLLGRGPMLVGGAPAPARPAPAPPAYAPELPLQPGDLEPIEVPPARRPAANAGNEKLRPADISAVLALAVATTEPARGATPSPQKQQEAEAGAAVPVATTKPEAPAAAAPPAAAPVPEPTPERPAPPPATPAPFAPEAYLAGALHAQHLQHQLALAELRNQHLLEQQQMLREMLAMARQGMV